MKKAKKPVLLAGGILLLLLLLFRLLPGRGLPAGEELLTNGSFAELTAEGLPAGWYTEAYFSAAGYTGFSLSQGPDGMQALSIVNYQKNDARIAQEAAVEPNSLYCLSGLICAQAEGGWGANLSIAGVYAAASDGVYDSQGQWQRVALYGRTGPEQHTLTVFARLGGYSGEALGQAQFAGLSLKKVEAVPEGAETALFYQPGQAAARAFPLDLRHALLAAFTALYALLVCACFRAKSLLGLMVLSLFSGALCLLFQAVGAPEPIEGARNVGAAMPYAPYVLYALLLATLAAALALGYRLAREGEPVPLFCGRRPGERPAGVFLRDEAENHRRPRRLDGRDAALALGIAALYALGAYSHLGSAVSPQTAFTFAAAGERAVFDLGAPQADFRMLYMNGLHESGNGFTVELSQDGESWEPPLSCAVSIGALYQWFYVTGDGMPDARALSGRYVRLTAATPGLTLLETLFRDAEGRPLAVTVEGPAGRDASALVDEPDTLEGEPGWYNGMYFDEIYHARTAYEHLHGLQPYEISHPPLGKVLMSWGIAAFGMTPFGWRFAGASCGVLMLPGMYLLGRLLFAKRRYALLACLALALDTLHFTQTRIATIDSFVVLFIIWAVYFMLRWFYADFFGKKLGRTLVPLALSGACMGLAVASKWTGCFAGVGLAAIFFLGVGRRWRAAGEAAALPPARRDGLAAVAAEQGKKRLLITVASCLIFFVLIPAGIYWCAYIPYFAPSGGVSLARIVDAAKTMLWYHGQPGLGMDHRYYAPWYRWPLSEVPMCYAVPRYVPQGYAYVIWAFGNYAVWWTGFAALLAVVYAWARHQALPVLCRGFRERVFPLAPLGERDARPALLLICFGAQFLPWTLVPRGTYIYHYFPSLPFIILCTAYVLEQLGGWYTARAGQRDAALAEKRAGRVSLLAVGAYLLLAAAFFIAFYPLASGALAPTIWLSALNWFGTMGY